jgi:hypothetical protein
VFSSVLVSNDKPCRDANCHTCFVYSLSLLNVQLVEKKNSIRIENKSQFRWKLIKVMSGLL